MVTWKGRRKGYAWGKRVGGADHRTDSRAGNYTDGWVCDARGRWRPQALGGNTEGDFAAGIGAGGGSLCGGESTGTRTRGEGEGGGRTPVPGHRRHHDRRSESGGG